MIANGYVASFDPELGDIDGCDVLIRDGRIAEVSPRIDVPESAEVIDASGKVVIPGLIDTHRHVWQGALGGIAGGASLHEYFDLVLGKLAQGFEPADVYAGALWGSLQALHAGVTTVVDWSHIVTTPEHADANLAALTDSGIRGVFLYGPPVALGQTEWFWESSLNHPDDVRRTRDQYFSAGRYGRLGMGLALRGPEGSLAAVVKHDFELARELDLPVSIHCGMAGSARRARTVATLAELDLLGPKINYVHANLHTGEELDLIADSGGSISACPTVDMLMAMGTYPAVGNALEHGVTCAISVDTVAGTGADLFSEMRVALAAERSRANVEMVARDESPTEVALDHRAMLRLATIDAARTCGLDAEIGSLTPGKLADAIIVDTRSPQFVPGTDVIGGLVMNAGASDVETVIVEGEVVKRGGALRDPSLSRARGLVEASQADVFGRANLDFDRREPSA
ncbi:MAG: amidohydrolase family protein [Solirubrobacterales bacterium]